MRALARSGMPPRPLKLRAAIGGKPHGAPSARPNNKLDLMLGPAPPAVPGQDARPRVNHGTGVAAGPGLCADCVACADVGALLQRLPSEKLVLLSEADAGQPAAAGDGEVRGRSAKHPGLWSTAASARCQSCAHGRGAWPGGER